MLHTEVDFREKLKHQGERQNIRGKGIGFGGLGLGRYMLGIVD
jgi:hypothetical protein